MSAYRDIGLSAVMRQMPNDAAARAECARVIRTGQRRFLQVLTLGEIS